VTRLLVKLTSVPGACTRADGSTRSVFAETAGASWPASRVGATFVASGDKVYLWGGRGGKAMGELTGDAGIWAYSPETASWEELQTKGDPPEPRSFHTMAALDVRSPLACHVRALFSHMSS